MNMNLRIKLMINIFIVEKIRYQKHIDTKIKHFISSLEDEPNKKLEHLYKFIPPELDERKKEFNILKEKEKNDFIELVQVLFLEIQVLKKNTDD